MELKLVVLAGAKLGTEIPLKKDEFVIGRAKECTLRAASEAISRRHCVIARSGDRWSIRDLKSRNGTYVNEQRIEAATPLSIGDELRVGPLKFRVDSRAIGAAPPISADIPRGKQSAVKDVSEVAERSVGKSDAGTTEEDISRWLLGVPESKPGDSLKETRTIRMEETTTINRTGATPVEAHSNGDATEPGATEENDQASGEDSTAGGWSWMKRGKNQPKKKPGKLPPRQAEQSSKDSREAAADILREMTRRR
jgi:predicted component of type VI protein secretion system